MTRISTDLLSDTYNLIQLARETARAGGRQDQAERLSPLVDDLRSLITTAQDPGATAAIHNGAGPQVAPARSPSVTTPASGTPAPVTGPLAQDDFRLLLQAVQGRNGSQPITSASPAERAGIVLAMAAGGMGKLEIARQMGMTREEVNLVIGLGER